MSPVGIAIIGLGAMFMLMILRMPIGFAMLLAGFLGVSVVASPDAALNILSSDIWSSFSSYGLSVIPMFFLWGKSPFALE